MIYLQCPKCGNIHTTLFTDDVALVSDKHKLKAVCCPKCGPLYLFEDNEEVREELKSQIDDLEGEIDDLKDAIDCLNIKIKDLTFEEQTDINPY